MKRQLYTAQCPECGKTITDKEEPRLRRRMGTHRMNQHQVAGITATPEGQRRNSNISRMLKNGMSRAEAEARADELENRFRARQAQKAQEPMSPTAAPVKKSKGVQMLEVSACPQCQAEFFCRIDGKDEALKLTYCPRCHIRFYFTGGV